MKTYNAVYTNSVKSGLARGMGWAVLLNYDDESVSLRFATRDERFATSRAYGVVTEIDFSPSGFDPYDGTNINASCTIVMSDEVRGGTYKLTDILTGKAFINRRVRIYRYATDFVDAGLATPFVNDTEFDGVVTDYYFDVSKSSWIFECEHLSQHRQIPQTTVTKEAYPVAPESSIGAVIPIVYGVFDMSTTRADGAHGLFHLAPTVCTNTTKGIYTVADHAVYGMATSQVAVWLDGSRTYGHGIHAYTGSVVYPSVTITGPSYIQIPVPANGRVFKCDNAWLRPKLKGTYNQVTADSDNAVDGDYNTALTIGASTRYSVRFPYGVLGNSGEFRIDPTASASDISTFAFFKAHSGSAIGGGLYNPINTTAYIPSSVSGTGYMTFPVAIPTSGNRSDNDGGSLSSTTQWTWNEVGQYEYFLSVQAASSVDISTMGVVAHNLIISGTMREEIIVTMGRYRSFPLPIFRLSPGWKSYEVKETVYRHIPDPSVKERGLSNIFTEVYGRKFGTWIGTRNGLSSSTVINTSNYMIESVLRDEMGVSGSFIDTTAFDNDYSSAYVFAMSLNKQTSTQAVIHDMAFQSACYVYRKTNGVWTILRLPTTPSSSAVDFNMTNGDAVITSVYKTPHAWIENEVRVLYNYDYAMNEFTWDTSDEDTTSKGNTSVGNNATASIEFGADYIRKSSDSVATNYAISLRNYRLAQWKNTHNVIEFDCLNPAYFNLEEGDIVTFANVANNYAGIGSGSVGDYWSSFASPAAKYWLIHERRPMLDKVFFKAIQLHNL